MGMLEKDWLAAEMPRFERQNELAAKIREERGLPYITSIVMAGDQMSAERALEKLEAGECDVDRALLLTGSYARLDLAINLMHKGYLTERQLLKQLPELWTGSDPDDSSKAALEMWKDAKRGNRNRVITDGHRLPAGEKLTVYRGQMPGDGFGISWTTDDMVAAKFAGGASLRVRAAGIVWQGTVRRADILAYLTGRGESEVIVDPERVLVTRGQRDWARSLEKENK